METVKEVNAKGSGEPMKGNVSPRTHAVALTQ